MALILKCSPLFREHLLCGNYYALHSCPYKDRVRKNSQKETADLQVCGFQLSNKKYFQKPLTKDNSYDII